MVAEGVDVRTAREMVRAGDIVVDVRSPAEYAGGHIAGAVNIPLEELTLDKLPSGPVLTACSMGGRAARAAELIDRNGREAFVISGGTKAWQAAGYPIAVGSQP